MTADPGPVPEGFDDPIPYRPLGVDRREAARRATDLTSGQRAMLWVALSEAIRATERGGPDGVLSKAMLLGTLNAARDLL